MKIINLTQVQYRNYSNIHNERNFGQTIEYSLLPENNNEKKLYNQLVVVGEPKVSFININDVVLVKEDTFTTKNLGTTTMQAIYNNEVISENKGILAGCPLSAFLANIFTATPGKALLS